MEKPNIELFTETDLEVWEGKLPSQPSSMKLHALPRRARDQPPHAGATSRLLSSRAASHLHIQEAAEGTELPLAGLLTSAGTVMSAL